MPHKGYVFKTHCVQGHLRKNNTDSRGTCKTCKNIWSEKNRKNNLDKSRKYRRERYKKTKKHIRELYVLKEYGLTEDEYLFLLKKQNNKCCICGVTLDCSRKLLIPHIDHVHDKTKRVRGLLCGHCNVLLGVAHDSVVILKNAIKYLRKDNKHNGRLS
jgi:hypothetical protein